MDKNPQPGLKERIEDGEIDPSLLEALPLGFVKKNLVLPLKVSGSVMPVAVASLSSIHAIDDISRLFSVAASPVLVPEKEIIEAINRHYGRLSGSAEKVASEITEVGTEAGELGSEWEEPKDLLDLADEAPIIRLLNSILFQAVKEKASDVHIEPYEREVEVRFRRDGILQTVVSPPRAVQEPLVSRVKIMSGLDIAEKRLPQDGRLKILAAGREIDVRVSIVPTSFGERVVLRLLDRRAGAVTLDGLGLPPGLVTETEALLTRNNGIILATGPTGSGKTTTLYAFLNRINTRERNVITVEDPVEYQLKGVGQIQVNTKIGLTFASGLRSILRQDPDVIMIGEIRDPETAEMAIQASLTGHLVLSTLHTNDAPSAAARLVDMGVQPFLLSSSLSCVVAQRLVRVLCTECREEYAPSSRELSMLGGLETDRLWRAKGCARCFNTGYSGQTGLFEFMEVDTGMRHLMLKTPDAATLREYAASKGMRSLWDDGLSKAAAGVTSLEEVMRVTHA